MLLNKIPLSFNMFNVYKSNLKKNIYKKKGVMKPHSITCGEVLMTAWWKVLINVITSVCIKKNL